MVRQERSIVLVVRVKALRSLLVSGALVKALWVVGPVLEKKREALIVGGVVERELMSDSTPPRGERSRLVVRPVAAKGKLNVQLVQENRNLVAMIARGRVGRVFHAGIALVRRH